MTAGRIFDQTEWLSRFEAEAHLRQQVGRSDGPQRDQLRAHWAAIERALMMYRVGLHERGSVQPPPIEMLQYLQIVAGNLAIGTLPPDVVDVRTKGRPSTQLWERNAIGWAAAYHRLAKLGVIDDRHPTKTVADKFGVDTSTVNGWVKKPLPEGIDWQKDEGAVMLRLDQAARRYRRYGRSTRAVADRNEKRGPK